MTGRLFFVLVLAVAGSLNGMGQAPDPTRNRLLERRTTGLTAPEIFYKQKQDALVRAIEDGNDEAFQAALSAIVLVDRRKSIRLLTNPLDFKMSNGLTPAEFAQSLSRLDFVNKLLENGATQPQAVQEATGHLYQNVSTVQQLTQDQQDIILAIKACDKPAIRTIASILVHNKKIDFIDPETGKSPLILAITSNEYSYNRDDRDIVVRMLLGLGQASVSEPKFEDKNPLEYAMESNLNKEIVARMAAIMHPNAEQ